MNFANKMKKFFSFLMYKILRMSAKSDEDIQKVENDLKRDRAEVLTDYLKKKSTGPQDSDQLGTLEEELKELTRQMTFANANLWDLLEIYEIFQPIYSNISDIEQLELSLTANSVLLVQINIKKQEAASIQDKNSRNNRKQECKDLVA